MTNRPLNKENSYAPSSLEGSLRLTEKDDGAAKQIPNPEVSPIKPRRRFTAEYKLRILAELDRCTAAGGKGAILRREGLYASRITYWRQLRDQGLLTAFSNTPGRKKVRSIKDDKIASLEKEVARLQQQLKQATAIIDVQKKVSEIFGINDQNTSVNGSLS